MSSGSRRNKDRDAVRKEPKPNEHVAAPQENPATGISPQKVPDERQRMALESLIHGRSGPDGMMYKRPGNPENGVGGNPEVKVTGDTPLVDQRPDTFNESARTDMDRHGGRKKN